MYIISSRVNYSNPDELMPSGHTIREIDLSDDSNARSFSDLNEFLKNISGKRLLMLVHGYNNEQDEIYDAYSIIEEKVRVQLNSEYDDVMGYIWPGGDSKFEWWQAKRSANGVARRFRRLIERLSESAASLDLMSHSLGARVILKAMKQANANNGKVPVRNYYCTAASVDDEVFEPREEFYSAMDKFGQIYVFHSRRDKVLKWAYGIAESDVALGLSGPEDRSYIQNSTKNVFVINCKKKVTKHGHYKHSNDLYAYIARAFSKRPRRFVTL